MIAKVKQVVRYGGHSIGANGIVRLTLKADYSELPNTVQLLQMLNNDIHIRAKLAEAGIMDLGEMKLDAINFSSDGESTVKLKSITDHVDVTCLNRLPMHDDDILQFVVRYEADVDEEEGDEEDA